jgi:hypothetical protein
MANVNTTVFANFRGQLDGVGRAAATLRVPALPPGAVTLYHAFVVYDNQGGFHLASNPVVLRIR